SDGGSKMDFRQAPQLSSICSVYASAYPAGRYELPRNSVSSTQATCELSSSSPPRSAREIRIFHPPGFSYLLYLQRSPCRTFSLTVSFPEYTPLLSPRCSL